MRWLTLSFIIFVHALLPAKEAKPILRALIACDLTSKEIRPGSRADLIRMKKSCIAIARQLGITPKITTLQGKKFSVKRVSNWLNAIPKQANDIVFFYYSGHGGRYNTLKDPWPFLIFPLPKNPRKAKTLMGGSVYKLLAQKKPRLSIIIFDCCNNFFQSKDAAGAVSPVPPMITSSPILPGLKTLFLQSRGIITSCAARPGEIAITTVRGAITGGIFTTGFLFSLKYFAQQPAPTWDQVFTGAATCCQRYTHGKQNPKFTIKTKQHQYPHHK